MGRRKRVQKNTDENPDGNGQTSTSSSSKSTLPWSGTSQGQNDTIPNKIEGQVDKKKIEKEDSFISSEKVEADPRQGQGQGQGSSVQDGPINNLPPEMLTRILKYVDTRSLLKCRLVNRQWLGISTGLFQNRPPAGITPLWFLYEKGTFSRMDGRSLKEFVECAKKSNSETSPFVYFYFTTFGSTCFDDKDFREFLSLFSTRRLKHVNLCAKYPGSEFLALVKKLRRFLLKDIPQVEELQLELSLHWLSLEPEPAHFKHVPLFPRPINEDGAPLPVQFPVQVRLPHLKILELNHYTIPPHLQFSKDLLNAAVNLTRIKTSVTTPEDFEFFQSLGKLDLVKELVFSFDEDFVEDMKRRNFQNWSRIINSFPRLHLENLHLLNVMAMSEFDQVSLGQTSQLISTLLELCKDSLKELKVDGFAFLSHLQLPVFKKMRKLVINATEDHQFFPSGTRTRNIFPVVDSLDLCVEEWSSAFPQQDSIPRLPSVKTLIVREYNFETKQIDICVSNLALLCPNLKQLVVKETNIDSEPRLDLSKVCRSIWTHMKDLELESLELDVDLDKPENDPIALDSCFSGVSLENCRHLLKLTEAKRFLEENGILVEIPESKLTAEREHPSILDMKDLRKLTINPYSGKNLLNKKEFLANKLTWISQKFAFKLMPQLKFNQEDSHEEVDLDFKS